jgi:hypothetical protein
MKRGGFLQEAVMSCWLSVGLVATLAWGVLGMIAEPYPRIFASSSGALGMKVLPEKDKRSATGVLFTLKTDGSEDELWRKPLVNLPGDVMLYDWGGRRFVVTLDTWGRAGGPDSLVIYDQAGQVVARLSSQQITGQAPAGPIAQNGGRAWRDKAEFVTHPTAPHLLLLLKNGQAATVDLTTGAITKDD